MLTAELDFRHSRRLWPILAAGLLHTAALGLYLAAFHFDLGALVCVGSQFKSDRRFDAVHTTFGTVGYDGQFYYLIAQDPFRRQDQGIDFPSYRHARILYPAVASALCGGDPFLLLWVMPLLNVAAVMGIAWLGTLLALAGAAGSRTAAGSRPAAALAGAAGSRAAAASPALAGRNVWWGLLLPIAVNSILPSLRDLTDTFAALAAVGLLAAWLLEWRLWVLAAWGVAAVLSREQNLAIVAALVFQAIVFRRWRRLAVLSVVVAIEACWILTLRSAYGAWPAYPGNVETPLSGMVYFCTHAEGRLGVPLHVLCGLLLACQFGASLVVLARGDGLTRLLALAGLALACLASHYVYADSMAYSRVLNWVPLAIWLWAVQDGKRWPIVVLLLQLAWPVGEIIRVWSH